MTPNNALLRDLADGDAIALKVDDYEHAQDALADAFVRRHK